MQKTDELNSATIRQVATAVPQWFELMMLRRMYTDLNFYARMNGILGTAANGGEVRDMECPINNALLEATKAYTALVKRDVYDQSVNIAVVAQVLSSFAAAGKHLRLAEVPEAVARIGKAMQVPLETAVRVTDDYVSEWLLDKRMRYFSSMLDTRSVSQAQCFELISLERSRVIAAMKSEDAIKMFGHGLDNPPPSIPRLATGFKALDSALGGGLGQGESNLVIACSGVGKTAFATQASSQMVMLNPNSYGLHIFTEQMQCDQERRIVSSACRVPFSMVRDGFSVEQLSQPQREAYFRVRKELAGRLAFMRWEFGKNIKDGIQSVYRSACQQLNHHIDFVTLDWIGGGITQDVKDEREVRRLYQNTADWMAELAEQEGIAALIFAQADETKAVNRLHVDNRTLRECKSMHVRQTTTIGLTCFLKSDEDIDAESSGGKTHSIYRDDQFFYLGKSRKSANTAVPVRRNMAYQRFDDVSFRT